MAERVNTLPQDLLQNFNILHSKGVIQRGKKNILVLHDDIGQGHLKNFFSEYKLFDKIVYVSRWQKERYENYYKIPNDAGVVIRNATYPFHAQNRERDGKVRLIYFSTPHRGLNLLPYCFGELYKKYGDAIELNVYSSYNLYGWQGADDSYEKLFNILRNQPGINYYGSIENEDMRKILMNQDILAYPSTFAETSCLVLIESMMAGLRCVHSSLGALPETAMYLTNMYEYTPDMSVHATRFIDELDSAIKDTLDGNFVDQWKIDVANQSYSWYNRSKEWMKLLESMT